MEDSWVATGTTRHESSILVHFVALACAPSQSRSISAGRTEQHHTGSSSGFTALMSYRRCTPARSGSKSAARTAGTAPAGRGPPRCLARWRTATWSRSLRCVTSRVEECSVFHRAAACHRASTDLRSRGMTGRKCCSAQPTCRHRCTGVASYASTHF